MRLDEIILPITSPETEWIDGREVQKVSPTRDHGRVQALLAGALGDWAEDRGEIATEWRFRVAPPDGPRRPLVPDIAYVSYERLRGLTREAIQAPAFAPTIAIEVLSPGDRPADVASKVDGYLRSGCELVLIVDPSADPSPLMTARAHESMNATLPSRIRSCPDSSCLCSHSSHERSTFDRSRRTRHRVRRLMRRPERG